MQTSPLPPGLADAVSDAIFRARTPSARAAKIEELLRQHPAYAAAIHAAVAEWAAIARSEEPALPEPIGPYRITARLGRGGFGEVYLAEQEEPVRRLVALKVLKRGMDSDAILRRFEREQQALARMDHEAVAKFYAAGTTAAGQPYFAMEYVEGQPIVGYCEQHGLSLEDRVRLLVQVCRGVQHAHQRGVVHRDLKPSNVLVAQRGAGHIGKLIDFGIARALHAADEDLTRTEGERSPGTPLYMAPEQFAAEFGQVDTRTDVWALGALLCETIAGSSPFAHVATQQKDAASQRDALRNAEPLRPSLVAPPPGHAAHGWKKRLAGDLDWIVLKALRREQDLRYESAAALADDLERFLAYEPVTAGPPTIAYRAKKFARKYRTQVVAASVVLATAVLGAAIAIHYAQVATQRASDNAITAERLSAKVREFDLLSCVVTERQAREAEASLYPAWPQQLDAMQRWLDGDIASLEAQRAAIDATIEKLRAQALPWSEGEQAIQASQHPRRAEWDVLLERIARAKREISLAAGSTPQEPIPDVDPGMSHSAAAAAAWARVAPLSSRTVTGEEALGLAYAQRAMDSAKGAVASASALETLAWAFVANGRDGDAIQIAQRMVAECEPYQREACEKGLARIQAVVANRAERLKELEQEAEKIRADMEARPTWTFGDSAEGRASEFLHASLCDLRARWPALQSLVESVRERMRWAEMLRAGLTRAHPKARCGWDEARRIASESPRYKGTGIMLVEAEMHDLVPIGENPATGLLEFYHLPSAWDGMQDPRDIEIPAHQQDGSFASVQGLGIVLALIPGGMSRCGAQAVDPNQPLYDPDYDKEPFVVEVDLEPYLVARHEMTQQQWARLWRGAADMENPSHWGAGETYGSPRLPADAKIPALTPANPVENVDWDSAVAMLSSYGLRLPTSVQWEHAARAGSDAPWHTGRELAALKSVANLCDELSHLAVPQWTEWEKWNDGHVLHARVGSFAPNAFGLYDVHGNVLEWCLDVQDRSAVRRGGDGLTMTKTRGRMVMRGGCYTADASLARFGTQPSNNAAFRDMKVGLRVARPLQPSKAQPFR